MVENWFEGGYKGDFTRKSVSVSFRKVREMGLDRCFGLLVLGWDGSSF